MSYDSNHLLERGEGEQRLGPKLPTSNAFEISSGMLATDTPTTLLDDPLRVSGWMGGMEP